MRFTIAVHILLPTAVKVRPASIWEMPNTRKLFALHRGASDKAQIDLRIVAASRRLVASGKVVRPLAIEGVPIDEAEFPQEFWMILPEAEVM